MTNVRRFSVDEAITVVGEGRYGMPGRSVDRASWGRFVTSNVDYEFINVARSLFGQINPVTLDGLDQLCCFVSCGVEPNRMVGKGLISCRIAPSVADGSFDDIGRLSLGVCYDPRESKFRLILQTQGRDLNLTWGWGETYQYIDMDSNGTPSDQYRQAEVILESWGNRIAGKRVMSVA